MLPGGSRHRPTSCTAATLEATVADFTAQAGLEMKVVAQPLRVALTGRSASPGLYDVLDVLGRERSLQRLAAAQALCLAPA